MSRPLVYLDTSALVKLVHRAHETEPLRRWLSARPGAVLFSSDLARVELARALRRMEAPESELARATELLDTRVVCLRITPVVLAEAGRLPDPLLRSLDAIHLATALTLGEGLEAMVTYDRRLARASEAQRVAVASPR